MRRIHEIIAYMLMALVTAVMYGTVWLIIIGVFVCPAKSNDLIQAPTKILAWTNGDDFALRDSIFVAMAIHKMDNGKYRILPQTGGIVIVDNWRPIQ